MTSPVHAPYYADSMVQETVEVLQNVSVAQDTYRLRFRSPAIARRILPGQFLMLRLHDLQDPLIGRPFALYDTQDNNLGEPETVDVVYVVKGKLTSCLQHLQPGQLVDVWGPLGNGFPAIPTDHLICVAGGIGHTPFLALGREYKGTRHYGPHPRIETPTARMSLCYGARSASYLAGVEDFERAGFELQLCTDDGTRGRAGLVTEALRELLRGDPAKHPVIHCCGPEVMMAAVSQLAADFGVPCYVSLETPMACGIGICFTCVAKVRDADGEWDYKRTCVEGPIFASRKIVW
jgi:dihydroorotate dehydrogenase electron transfer subunit